MGIWNAGFPKKEVRVPPHNLIKRDGSRRNVCTGELELGRCITSGGTSKRGSVCEQFVSVNWD